MPPWRVARRFSRAALRASASVTTGNEPSPMLTGLPLMRSRWLQVRECPPSFIGLTSSESPWLPRPSPYRPGLVTVLTKVAESRFGVRVPCEDYAFSYAFHGENAGNLSLPHYPVTL